MTERADTGGRRPRRVLAVSYMLPPALYPQAIQIGRLLSHSAHTIFSVYAIPGPPTANGAAEPMRRLRIADTSPSWPLLHRLATKFLPRYGAVPDEHVSWSRAAAAAVLADADITRFAPEVLVTFGEPMSDHLVGLALKHRMGLPWIAHFSDPWADNPFRRPHKLARNSNRALEAEVVANADALIFTAEETRDLFAAKYADRAAGRLHVLPHSFEPALYPPRSAAREPVRVVRYLGNFYGSRTPLPLLRAIELARRDDPGALAGIRFEFVGGLPAWLRHHPVVRRADANLVRFLPSIGYRESLALMVDADVLLVIDAPAERSLFLPSKLIDYLGADRPMLGIVPPGPSERLLRALGEPVADPRDTAAIAGCIRRLARERAPPAAAEAVRRPVIDQYQAPRVSARFDAIIERLLAPEPAEGI